MRACHSRDMAGARSQVEKGRASKDDDSDEGRRGDPEEAECDMNASGRLSIGLRRREWKTRRRMNERRRERERGGLTPCLQGRVGAVYVPRWCICRLNTSAPARSDAPAPPRSRRFDATDAYKAIQRGAFGIS